MFFVERKLGIFSGKILKYPLCAMGFVFWLFGLEGAVWLGVVGSVRPSILPSPFPGLPLSGLSALPDWLPTLSAGFDFSKLVGTWRNGEGRTITINADGTYSGDETGEVGTEGTRYNDTDIWSVGIRATNSNYSSLLFYAPAGTSYPTVGQAKDASDISQDRFMLTNAYPVGTATNTYYRVAAESKPADNTTKPVDNTAKPVDNTTKPVDNTTKPVDNGQKATKPNETGKLALNATKKENHNQVKTLGAGITKKANGTVSYSRIAANNTLPKTGEENNTSSILAGLALLLSGSLFLGKRKED